MVLLVSGTVRERMGCPPRDQPHSSPQDRRDRMEEAKAAVGAVGAVGCFKNWACFFWVSSEEDPYYLRFPLGPLIFGNSQLLVVGSEYLGSLWDPQRGARQSFRILLEPLGNF